MSGVGFSIDCWGCTVHTLGVIPQNFVLGGRKTSEAPSCSVYHETKDPSCGARILEHSPPRFSQQGLPRKNRDLLVLYIWEQVMALPSDLNSRPIVSAGNSKKRQQQPCDRQDAPSLSNIK